MKDDLPSGWVAQFIIIILLFNLAIALIPTAYLVPVLLWDYWFPPGSPQPLTTPLLSITFPLWALALFLLILGYYQAKRFIHRTREWYQTK